jgi:hypothetical protein
MGKASRDELYKGHKNPGPGSYESNQKFHGPKYHFGGRQSQSMSNLAPGPGQYTPDFRVPKRNTTFKISFSGRPSSANPRSGPPGPGTYEIKVSKLNKGGRFGKDNRRSLSLLQNVPGPGSYAQQPKIINFVNSPRYT